MFNWEIKRMYEYMIDEYKHKIGKKSKYGVTITPMFILILRKRLSQLRGEMFNGLL